MDEPSHSLFEGPTGVQARATGAPDWFRNSLSWNILNPPAMVSRGEVVPGAQVEGWALPDSGPVGRFEHLERLAGCISAFSITSGSSPRVLREFYGSSTIGPYCDVVVKPSHEGLDHRSRDD